MGKIGSKIVLALVAGLLGTSVTSNAEDIPGRWSSEKANAWYAEQPWLVGCNFLPSTAVNDVEMWQRETFDDETIGRELGWTHDLGFNTVRVFLNYIVWESDAAGLKQRFGRFLAIAAHNGIRVLPILFDDCFKPEPHAGRQEEPVPGVHNSQWVQSPGVRRRGNRSDWPKLEQYVQEMVGTFADDPRVLAWEVYNEPTQSLPLVEAAFRRARQAKPSQPVTATVYGTPEMRQRILELSDVISFHQYGPLTALKAEVARLREQKRPLLCTEWMARKAGSRFETHLPFFKEQKIGCWNWGFVAGRTQTFFPWGSKPGSSEPSLWFHDVLHRDGSPYRDHETATIRYLTGRSNTPPPPLPQPQMLIPTAESHPVIWRYTTQQPAGAWTTAAFDDSLWSRGETPFGRKEPKIGRHPRTEWTSGGIWLRREVELPPGHFCEIAVVAHYDEDAEVYVDGELAARLDGFNAEYMSYPMSKEAKAKLLVPGKHLLAVRCRQTVGGQYMDVGIEGVLSKSQSH